IIYILTAIIPFNINKGSIVSKIYPYANAGEILKINSINFDNSDSIIFLGTSGIEEPADIKITKKVLTEPDRVFFDIENAVLTFSNTSYELKNSRLKQVKIAQNSTEPNIVRVVIWNTPNYNSSQIKILKIKNNIIIKLNNEIPLQSYLTQTYKETDESAIEYYDKTVVIPEEKKEEESNEIFDKVQKAFKEGEDELVRPNIEQRQARLKSRFFLEKAILKNGNILIGGIGVINVEKPFILQNPSRIIFDLPNTIVASELRNKEIKLSETETFKIGQFEPSKARIVIKTNNPENYRPVYSTNLQTLLIAGNTYISGVNVTPVKSELAYFKEQSVNNLTDVVNIIFSQPVIYSIKRENKKLNVTFYNLSNFDTDAFNALALKNKTGYEAEKLGTNMYRISFPINETTLADCYETLNASQLRFVFTKKQLKKEEISVLEEKQVVTSPKKQGKEQKREVKKESPFANLLERSQTKSRSKVTKTQPSTESKIPERIKNKVIIIDPGHGGNDTGALRANVLEKDITLAIALKVRNCLIDKGFNNIIMTRSSDKTLTLENRVQIANNNKADIFVSIHINASVKSEIKGIETHYYTENGYGVAKVIHNELTKNVNAIDRGLFKSKFYVINHTEAPSVLLELGFISNEQERNALNSEKRQLESAQAIADGIADYLTEH
ncbi:MAG: N-acetylmuramoyl-L-alanine amidase, partial [Candidatus Gastranaerophilales bacterium]|nr:N-acetylmuramoyl-L-alanine amidase [Candidatus Gastranaerophilales bacterium]